MLTGKEDRKGICKNGDNSLIFTFEQGYDGSTLKPMTIKGIITNSGVAAGKIANNKKYGVYIYEYGTPPTGDNMGNIFNPSGGTPGVTDGRDPNSPPNANRRDGDVLAYPTEDISNPVVLKYTDNQLTLFGSNSIAGRGLAVHAAVANPTDDFGGTAKILTCNIVLCDTTTCLSIDN